jgi:vesicular inhibitory amino acid transporter
MDIRGKQPSTWDNYEGGRSGSVGSDGSRVQWGQLERRPSGESTAASGTWSRMPGELRRRRYVAQHPSLDTANSRAGLPSRSRSARSARLAA